MICYLLGRRVGWADKASFLPPLMVVFSGFIPNPEMTPSYTGTVVFDLENGTMAKLDDGIVIDGFDIVPVIAVLPRSLQ